MLIRQGAFKCNGQMLKGGLHIHSTRSDGVNTPEEMLAKFEQEGFDFVALTDHRRYNKASFGSRMTILPGMEIDASFADSRQKGLHVFHVVCLGPTDGGDFEQDESFQSFEIQKPEDFQPVLDEMHRRGCLTFYCHPEWSHTPVHEYMGLKGNFAMELFNTGDVIENDLDTDNSVEWEYVMDSGNRLYGVAVDDCHQLAHAGQGYVVVNAENTVQDILRALEVGNFYSSCGPEITDFFVDDRTAVLKCPLADMIAFSCSGMAKCVMKNEGGLIESASIQVPTHSKYVRAMVVRNGKRAWTNPIWLDQE